MVSVAKSGEVPKADFETVIRTMLRVPPMPASDIRSKPEPKQIKGPRNKEPLGAKTKRQAPLPPRDSQGPSFAKRPPGALAKPQKKRR